MYFLTTILLYLYLYVLNYKIWYTLKSAKDTYDMTLAHHSKHIWNLFKITTKTKDFVYDAKATCWARVSV